MAVVEGSFHDGVVRLRGQASKTRVCQEGKSDICISVSVSRNGIGSFVLDRNIVAESHRWKQQRAALTQPPSPLANPSV